MPVRRNLRPAAVDSGPPPDGAGPTLLLVHGWGGDSGDWAAHLPLLAPHHRVLAPDLPGHGATPDRPGRCSPRDLAADLADWLVDLDTGPVVAVGHPAARLPARQEALRREGVAWGCGSCAAPFSAHTPPAVRARHERLMAAMDPEVLIRYREAMYLAPGAFGLRPAAEGYPRGRSCPALAVHTTPAAAAWERGLPRHPRSRVVLWEGCGHYPHEERPAELAALLRAWCAEAD
jgi:pimeloyl-ACP methyl ester carboxylesterase